MSPLEPLQSEDKRGKNETQRPIGNLYCFELYRKPGKQTTPQKQFYILFSGFSLDQLLMTALNFCVELHPPIARSLTFCENLLLKI